MAIRRLWSQSCCGLLLLVQLLLSPDSQGQNPTHWEEAMRAFAAEDAITPPPTNAIVFTGSSSIVFWKSLARDMAPLIVINRGFGGSTLADALYWLDTLVLKYKPRAVVLYEGDNDIGEFDATPESVLKGFETFVARIHAERPEARIYFLSIKPSPLRWAKWPQMRRANELIRAFCESRPQLHFIDVGSPMLGDDGRPRADLFESDELHLNTKGYELWTSLVRPILLEHESRTGKRRS